MPAVTTRTIELDGQPVFLRCAGEDPVPVLYLHGLPTSSLDWVEPLAATGGVAPDLPGFGRSGKRGDLDYTLEGQAGFVGRLLDELGVQRVRLVVHDWGAAGLVWAMEHPERVERLLVVNAVPLLPGYRWHLAARAWRTPGVGEFAVGGMVMRVWRRALRHASGSGGPLPAEMLDALNRDFDQGTQRAVLRLLRATPPEALARAGERLDRITAPALVLWGDSDPWLPAELGARYAAELPDATHEEVAGAGHWAWIDRPDVVERMVAFLTT